MALQQEIWLESIVKNLYPDDSFWMKSRDESVYLSGNKTVHVPQRGTKPNVVKNRSSFPATISTSDDSDFTYDIDAYSSDPILVRNAEEAELSYQKREAIIEDQMMALRENISDNMLVNWAAVGSDNIVRTTGSSVAANAPSATGNRKAVQVADIIKLAELFDRQNVPSEGRYLLMPPNMYAQILGIDALVDWDKMGAAGVPEGNIKKLYGFKVMRRSKVLIYTNAATPIVKAAGAAGAATDNLASLAWHESMVSRAVGTTELYVNENDATYYGDIMSVEARAGGRRRRLDHAGVAALVQAAV